MIDQLLISKKLYQEGCRQHDLGDPISDGVAVSLFQDAIEIFIWTLIKAKSISVGKNSEFTNNIGLIVAAGFRVPSQPKLLELNKARVNFKHYGNLPARRDVGKFRAYTQEFLVEACLEHFGISFSDTSGASLIRSVQLQEYFQSARAAANADELLPAYESLGKAKYVIFRELSDRLPRFETRDRGQARDFQILRDLLLVAIHKIDLNEYKFAAFALPTTFRMVSGKFQQNHNRTKYSQEEFNRLYDFLLDLCLKESL
ncbi:MULTISPECIES: hypothetical protein [Xanthomonas]|uniref:hypothetical protein n=1 Tax=Xanthomonas TaxID=338 RepID=UPI00225AE724|nr:MULTISPECIES: hypothetical protein [Xanthomonas]MCW0389840.1 hypothetical protein [Xanthomonas sacchari]MDY4283097.1 hypothetical protein [Xanthomonas sp. LF06-19]